MNCPTEFTCAVYADGELSAHETREVARHLDACGNCRRLVDALRQERQVLVHCFQDVDLLEFDLEDEDLSAPQAHKLTVTRFGLFVLAMATLLRPVFAVIGSLEVPASLEWLSPFGASLQLNVLSNLVVYVISGGAAIVDSIVRGAAALALGALVFIGLAALFRRSPITSALVSVMALLTVFSSSSYALDIRRGNQTVNVPSGETVDDTLIVFGESVNVDGTVNGDLIAFARHISVRGTVKGNLISFGQRVENEGTVQGSIFAFGQTVETRGQVGLNVYGFGQDVGIGNGAQVSGNAALFGGEINVQGAVGRDLTAYTERLGITGSVDRNVFARAGRVSVSAPSRIGGTFTARVRQAGNVQVDTGATIGGKRDVQVIPPPRSKYSTVSFYLWQIIWLAAAFVAGLVLFWLAPAFSRISLDTGRALLMTGGVGFLSLIVPPVAAIIFAVTLVGLPLGLITLTLWVMACYLSKVVIAGFLGRSLLATYVASKPPAALALLAGLVPVFIAINLPYIGGLIQLLLVVLGLGALAMTGYQSYGMQPAKAA